MGMRNWSYKFCKGSMPYIRAGALVMLFIFLISPLRNMVLFPVFPTMWRTHTSYLVAKMLMDNQHFPMETTLSVNSNNMNAHRAASLKINPSDLEKYMKEEEPYPEYFKQRELLQKRVSEGKDPDALEELEMLDSYKPPLSRKERAQLLFTLDVFVRACRQHNLTFVLIEGSLLGAYRHHGLIPWDDDVDVGLVASQWRLVQEVLGNIPGFTLYAPSDSQWKFYLTDLAPFPDKPFKWPNLDLFFLTSYESNDDSYVWALTWGLKHHFMLNIRHFLPLSTVVWEGRKLPAPACVERLVNIIYNTETCVTPLYVHKTNQERFSFQAGAVPCSRLHKYLPFVFRHQVPLVSGTGRTPPVGGTLESRMVGCKVLQNVTVPFPAQPCLK